MYFGSSISCSYFYFLVVRCRWRRQYWQWWQQCDSSPNNFVYSLGLGHYHFTLQRKKQQQQNLIEKEEGTDPDGSAYILDCLHTVHLFKYTFKYSTHPKYPLFVIMGCYLYLKVHKKKKCFGICNPFQSALYNSTSIPIQHLFCFWCNV